MPAPSNELPIPTKNVETHTYAIQIMEAAAARKIIATGPDPETALRSAASLFLTAVEVPPSMLASMPPETQKAPAPTNRLRR